MSKTIWFINDYAGSKYHGMEYRNYYFAKEFVKKGHNVFIITASYMHLFKKLPQTQGNFTFEKIDGITYIWIKVPNYGESTNKKRIVKWFIFTIKLFFLPLHKIKKPDVIIASPMAPFLILPAYKFSKKFNAKLIYEVKDIWPLSIVELGNISPKHPLIQMMSWCERFGIKKADQIVSSLQNYQKHLIKNLNINKNFFWINNGIDLDEVNKNVELNSHIKEKIPTNKFIIGYTGTIGIANALDYLLKAAKNLQNEKDILFVIVGSGKYKDTLKSKYGTLKNVLFLDPIEKNQVQSILKLFNICYIGWRNEKIYEFGISANKLFDYMYSGKPILHSYGGDEDIVTLSNCGITVAPEEPNAIENGIKKLYKMTNKQREILGQNGKKYVLENFTYSKLSKKYLEIIEG